MRKLSNKSLMWAMLLAIAVSGVQADSGGSGISAAGTPPSNSAARFDINVEFKKGQEALLARKFDDASRAFGRVLQRIPRDANTNLLAGMAKSGLGKHKDARKHFEKAAKYDDNLIIAHQELALVQILLGKRDDAEEGLANLRKRADKCAGSCPEAEALKVAVGLIEEALKKPSNSQLMHGTDLLFATTEDGDRAYLDAVALINDKQYDAALRALADSQRAFGPHPDILTYIGYTQRKLGRSDIAEDYYQRALAAAPAHLGALEYYGELKVERGDLDGARALLAKLELACTFGCAQADELRRWIAHGPPNDAS